MKLNKMKDQLNYFYVYYIFFFEEYI